MCKAKHFIETFIELNEEMHEELNILREKEKNVNLYEQDLLHVLENGNFNASEGYLLAKMVSENRQKRRTVKNELEPLKVLSGLFRYGDIDNTLTKTYKRVENKDRILQHLSTNKIYNPRIINTTNIKVIISNFQNAKQE